MSSVLTFSCGHCTVLYLLLMLYYCTWCTYCNALVCLTDGALCTYCCTILLYIYIGIDGEVKAKCVECEGDVPMPRSDHSVVGYDNRYLILFGGKNYQNEECYSDLYLLDLMSFEWSYVGEAGEEIDVRCGHSLGLLRTPPPQQQQIEQIEVQSIQGSRPGSVLEAETEAGAGAGAEVQPGVKTEVGEAPTAPPVPVATTYLVVFGGSHPETGTCANDTFFAMLPSSATDIGGKYLRIA